MTDSKRSLSSQIADELALLYALDLLQGAEREQAEAALANADFAQRVDDYRNAAAALPYGISLVSPAPDLKDRLWQRLKLPLHASDLIHFLNWSIADLKQQAAALSWTPLAGSSTAEMAIWRIDEPHREVAFFVRTAVGGWFPNHAHAQGETVLVLEGDFIVEGQVYGARDRIYSPAYTSHQPSTQQGCLLFCLSSLDDEILV
jgi:putative transcriptional regulator